MSWESKKVDEKKGAKSHRLIKIEKT